MNLFMCVLLYLFFFKQKTAYEIVSRDWSSDVCSSDLTTEMRRSVMRAPYAEEWGDVSDAYEVLLHDVLIGDATLFSRADEVEESWSILEPILDTWKNRITINRYHAGTWDIEGMDELFSDCVLGWHKPMY